MSHIAILHPQCARLGGAIQMALQTAQVLIKQGHKVVVYTFEKNDACFPELQTGLDIRVWDSARKVGFLPLRKLLAITSLAWELRHVDIIIANNPPMQIAAALTKLFISRVQTIWWHHHVPWYLRINEENEGMKEGRNIFKNLSFSSFRHCSFVIAKFLKGFLEKAFVIPRIDQMIATSYFVAEKIQMYCNREATVIHPILAAQYEVGSIKTDTKTNPPSLNTYDLIPNTALFRLFTHGRLEPGKGIDIIIRVWERLKKENNSTNLLIFGTGSLEKELREKGINVQPFDRKNTFRDILSGQYGHVLGVYCSQIDAFGMAPLEAQAAGISTIILDSGGARETILTNLSDEPVGYLVHSEEDLLGTIKDYVQIKSFPKKLSNVNFSHKREYFTPERLSSDISLFIEKKRV